LFALLGKVIIPLSTIMYLCSHIYLFSFIRKAIIEAKDINNYTPIMRAIAGGHQSIVKMFLEFGCKVNLRIRHQKTLLEWAIENGYNALIEVQIY